MFLGKKLTWRNIRWFTLRKLIRIWKKQGKKKYRTVKKLLDIVYVLIFRKVLIKEYSKETNFFENVKERRKKVENS